MTTADAAAANDSAERLNAGPDRLRAFARVGRAALILALLPLGPHVLLEIGSVTKVLTALLLANMAERSEVQLDDPIARHLPRLWRRRVAPARDHPLDTAVLTALTELIRPAPVPGS